jgi:peptidoglycan hydrolase-like protein with peptidoglycan-binding domain
MLVVVAAAVVLLGRSGGDEAADVAGRTVVTDAAVVESAVTQPAAAATAPAVTQPAAAATAPAVTQPATTSAPVLPSATWNGVYVIEPPVGPLLIGHKGRRVDALQLALVRRGYLSPPVDGDYGPATEAAVVRFQYDSGLVVDGVAGPATLAALGIA